MMNSSLSKAARIALSHATAAENDKEWTRALRFYQTALRTESKNPFIHYRIGTLFFRTGNSMGALRSLKAAAKLNPNEPEIMNLLGDVYGSLKNFSQAKDFYQQVLFIEPKNHHAQEQLLNPVFRESPIEKKHTNKDLQNESPPDLIQAIGVLATSYYDQGLLSQSTAKWEEILDIDPHNIHALEEIAGNYNEQGKTDLALEYCNKIVALDPENATMKLIRADSASALDEEDILLKSHAQHPKYQQIVQFKAQLKHSVDKVPILFKIAQIYADLHEKDLAIGYLDLINEIKPNYGPGEKLSERMMS